MRPNDLTTSVSYPDLPFPRRQTFPAVHFLIYALATEGSGLTPVLLASSMAARLSFSIMRTKGQPLQHSPASVLLVVPRSQHGKPFLGFLLLICTQPLRML